MAGFLDDGTRIMDVTLTNEGRRLLSQGKLGFVYWAAFDDEIDYDPSISSGSSDELVRDQIEATPVREATAGYSITNHDCRDLTNVQRPLFTMQQGSDVLPRMELLSTGSAELTIGQCKTSHLYVQRDEDGNIVQSTSVDVGVEREGASDIDFEMSYVRGSFPIDHACEGFLLRTFRDDDGFREASGRLDSNNDLCYDESIRIGRKG